MSALLFSQSNIRVYQEQCSRVLEERMRLVEMQGEE
jgi:hypothetical protein